MVTARDTFQPDALAGMTPFDLARWQLNEVLYIREVRAPQGTGFAVHAADGTFLFNAESMSQILAAARDNDMRLAAVH
jgi:hypothetical protein